MDLPRITLTCAYKGKTRFEAVDVAVQGGLERLLIIAAFMLRHPKLDAEASVVKIFGGFSGEEFVLTDQASLDLAWRHIGAVPPSRIGARQGSSLHCEYFDRNGKVIDQPSFDSIEGIANNLGIQKTVPMQLVELLNSLDS